MIKKFLRFLFFMALLAGVVFFFLVGKIGDRSMNNVEEIEEFPISDRAKKLHPKIYVSDLHADNLLWDRDILVRSGHGAVDIPKLIEGGYAIQVFDAVIKTPKGLNYEANDDKTDNIRLVAMANRWPIRTWFSQYNRAIHQSNILHEAANASSELEIVKSASDLDYYMSLRKSNSYIIGGVLAIEGLHALEGKMENLEGLINAGYRIMGLVHFFDNEVGGSSAGVEQEGLTDFGIRVVRRMEQQNIIVDLAHSSPALFDDVLDMATRPVVVSHTGVNGVKNSPRNLSDQQIRRIGENGGLIGIGFWAEAAGSTHPTAIASSIRYVSDMIGVEHVALGSDYDGAVTVGFDSSQIIYLTEALIQEGFSDEEIQLIMGGNQIRFLRENLPKR